jgi:hypothetical protein
VAVALLLAWPRGAAAQDTGTGYALIVGIDDYGAMGLSRLRNAESDARAMERYFVAQRYHVKALIGRAAVSKRAVRDAVAEMAPRVTERDRFVFFFAGHGKSQHQEGVDVAYLVVPGGRDARDPAALISTGDVAEYARALGRARHQLFIFDSCYAGLMGTFHTRGPDDRPRYDSEVFLLRDLSARRVRQYLSAGGENQEVLDNGPGNLSWFTYFLLKGLEPGVVTRRSSGLITFSELAAYVQAMSANPKHTPAFGSLGGHGGGEYLLYSTAQGTPALPRLPTITEQTLRDLGFLTRSEAPERVAASMERMREPIDRLYQGWKDKDLDLYLRQLDRGIVQTGRLKGGATFQRGYEEIARRRRADFARLDRVDVRRYEVMYQGSAGEEATFGVRYSMDFFWRDGTVDRERNINECYKVRRHATEDRWTIVRNDDYQRRICYR